MSQRIDKLLRTALMQNGPMAYALYEHELAEHIDYWYNGLVADQNEFVFAVTENSGDAAMVLVTKNKDVYVNEAAREKLRQWWEQAYHPNMAILIPTIAEELANETIAVNGFIVADY